MKSYLSSLLGVIALWMIIAAIIIGIFMAPILTFAIAVLIAFSAIIYAINTYRLTKDETVSPLSQLEQAVTEAVSKNDTPEDNQ